jgi:hypothetical protein
MRVVGAARMKNAPMTFALCETRPMPTLARLSLVSSLALGAALPGCTQGQAQQQASPSASIAPSPSASSARAPASAMPDLATPEPLDVATLQKTLKCSPKSEGGPCRVLNDFKGCQPQKLVTPSGDGRWMGYGYVVRAGAFTDEFTLLRSHAVPSADVGKTQIAAKIGLGRIPDDEEVARRQAEKAVAALARNDVPKVGNAAIAYIKELKEWSEAYAVTAQDNQIYVAASDGYYLCAVSAQRLLLVQRVTAPKSPGDGLYAELYPVSW